MLKAIDSPCSFWIATGSVVGGWPIKLNSKLGAVVSVLAMSGPVVRLNGLYFAISFGDVSRSKSSRSNPARVYS